MEETTREIKFIHLNEDQFERLLNKSLSDKEQWHLKLKNVYYFVCILASAFVVLNVWQFQQNLYQYQTRTNENTLSTLAWISSMNANVKEVNGMLRIAAPTMKDAINNLDNKQDALMHEIEKKQKEFY